MKDNKSKKRLKKNKYSYLFETRKFNSKEYEKSFLNFYLIDNDEFLPVIKLIEGRFEKFFDSLHRLTKHKKELELKKEALKLLFYNDVYLRVRDNDYLNNVLKIYNETESQLKNKNEFNENSEAYNDLIISEALDKFKSIVEDVFTMPEFVLTAFETKTNSLIKRLNNVKPEIKRAHIMTGKKLTKEKKEGYLIVLIKQKELVFKFGKTSQNSSLSNAIRAIHRNITKGKINSIAGSIRYHQQKGNLPK
jgi:hypothetical protein